MKTIQLSDLEQSIIQDALNTYWNAAHEQLKQNGVMFYDGSKRPLGDIERELLIQRKNLTKDVLLKIKQL